MRRRRESWRHRLFMLLPEDCRRYCWWMADGLQRDTLRLDEHFSYLSFCLRLEIDRRLVLEYTRKYVNPAIAIRYLKAYDIVPNVENRPVSIRPPQQFTVDMDWSKK